MAGRRPSARAAINFDHDDSDEWYTDLPGFPRDEVIQGNRTSTPAPQTPSTSAAAEASPMAPPRPKSPTPASSSDDED